MNGLFLKQKTDKNILITYETKNFYEKKNCRAG